MKKQFKVITIHKHNGVINDLMRIIAAQNGGEKAIDIEDIVSYFHVMPLFYPTIYKELSIERGEDGHFWLLEGKERVITLQEIELHELEGVGALAD